MDLFYNQKARDFVKSRLFEIRNFKKSAGFCEKSTFSKEWDFEKERDFKNERDFEKIDFF